MSIDGQMFGDFRPDPSGLWSDRDLQDLRRIEGRLGDDGRKERIAVIDREIERRTKEGRLSRMLSQKEVARLLGVTVRTVRNWEVRGLFPSGARVHGKGRGKVVRYPADDVERIVAEWRKVKSKLGKLGKT